MNSESKGESLLIYKKEKSIIIYYYSPQDIGKEKLISILKEKVKYNIPYAYQNQFIT